MKGDNMPNGNKTGPMGSGPMTGRGLGNCSDNNVQSNSINSQSSNNPVRGGFGMRRGAGRFASGGGGFRGQGRGFFRFASWSNESNVLAEKEILRHEQEMLKLQIDEVQKRIDNLSSSEKE